MDNNEPAGQVVSVNENHIEFYERVRDICAEMAHAGKLSDREILALLAQITGQSLGTQADEPGECYLSMMVNINYGQLTAYQHASQVLSTMMNVKGSA